MALTQLDCPLLQMAYEIIIIIIITNVILLAPLQKRCRGTLHRNVDVFPVCQPNCTWQSFQLIVQEIGYICITSYE